MHTQTDTPLPTKLPNIKASSKNRRIQDTLIKGLLLAIALLSASFIILIAVFVTTRGIIPFITDNNQLGRVDVVGFLTGRVWLGGATFISTAYGAGYLIVNTLYVVFLSLLVSFPVGVLTALFIAKIAPAALSHAMRTIVELLASIPSIVYGLVAAGVFLPWIHSLARAMGTQSSGGNSTFAVVIVLAMMSLPTITAVSEVAIRSVDKNLEHASLALGASPTQTHFKVVLAAAKSGIFAGAILAVGRALGEATAVSLVAGSSRSGPNLGLFDITATITSTMLEGMKETSGIDYDIRFSLGVLLMAVILITNFLLNFIKRKVGKIHV
ncbi:MAG: phosphate ABC transporter permease subunit PstC [Acholeplasmatales bacterium]|nr:MAG: phosphate ABC transporter permease subunit PstC [Acholeplasmatales bacterium]